MASIINFLFGVKVNVLRKKPRPTNAITRHISEIIFGERYLPILVIK